MIIYHYKQQTGEYINSSTAALDPIEQKPLIPAGAVTIEPPETGQNEVAVWANEKWAVVPDYRGFIGYDASGEKHEIKKLNQKPDTTWAVSERPSDSYDLIAGVWVLNEEKEKEFKLNQAKESRKQAYTTEADPLFFKAQRGEATVEEWQAKVNEIRLQFPYPEA